MVIGFSKGIALLLALRLVRSFITRRWMIKEPVAQVLSGLLFGGPAIGCIATPFTGAVVSGSTMEENQIC